MAVSLISTGVQFPDSTIQTTAAGGAPGLVKISTATGNGTTTSVNVDGITSTYTTYLLVFEGIYFDAGGSYNPAVRYRVSGSTDTNSVYGEGYAQIVNGAISGGGIGSLTSIALINSFPNNTGFANSCFGFAYISTYLNASGTNYIIRFVGSIGSFTAGNNNVYPNIVHGTYQGSSGLAGTVTGVNFGSNSNIYGKVTLYGLT